MKRILDLVLLPKSYYASFRSTKALIVPGMLVVGAIDMFISYGNAYEKYLKGRTGTVFNHNLVVIMLCIVVIGFLDVYMFSRPICDIANRFKNEEGDYVYGITVEKVMKVYILIHFIMVPINYLVNNILVSNNVGSIPNISYLVRFLGEIAPILTYAIITRGISAIGKLNTVYKIITFIVVYWWSFLQGNALYYCYEKISVLIFN